MDFETAVNHILRYEGVDSDDPLDAGGRTRFGIAQASHPDIDVPNITIDQAKAIYHRDYWLKAHCPVVPELLRLPMFDCAVNCGSAAAIKMLQRALGVPDDGKIGKITNKAIAKAVPTELWIRFMAERALHYARSKQIEHFGRGWMRRLMDVALLSARE
jgi:lysozyme family protein